MWLCDHFLWPICATLEVTRWFKNVHLSTIAVHERECYNYVCVQLNVGLCQCIHIYVHMYVLVCVRVRQRVHICITVSMCRQGVGLSCVLVCRRPWMLSRLQLGTAMVHVQCRKQEQAIYKLNGHTLETATFTLASSSIVLGCQSEQEVHGIFRFIWIL